MKTTLTGTVRSTFSGFQELIRIYHQLKPCDDPDCEVDLSAVSWFDANMCAPLGAVLFPFRHEGKRIRLIGLNTDTKSILQKNGFLPNFGFDTPRKPDVYGTTIQYQRFERSDAELFKQYVSKHFLGKGIPRMTQALHSEFRESIHEVFANAIDHSDTKLGIFACGQYFPRASRLDFCIADLGIGIRENVHRHMGLDLTPERAIAWALEGENTTRRKDAGKPGGLGLKLIREFIDLNGGTIHIVSDAGFWSYRRGEPTLNRFTAPFPGTIVNIEINTADKQSYCLTSEVDPNSIF